MRKLSKLFLMGVVALGLGFTACNNDDIDMPDQEKGNTHVSVTLKMTSSATRAAGEGLPENYNPVGTWGGKDEIKSITVYLVDGVSVNSTLFTVASTGADYDITTSTNGDIYLKPNTSAAMKTTAGQKTVYVVVNETPLIRSHLNKTPVHEFEQSYKNIPLILENSGTGATVSTSASKLAVINGTANETIVMTNVAPATLNVLPNITEEETIVDSENRASLSVERAVARAMVTIKGGPYVIPDPNTNGASNLGTLTDVTWVVAQGENSLFVKRNTNPWDWATPNWDWMPNNSAFYAQGTNPTNQKYDYSGLFENRTTGFGGTTVPTYADYSTNKTDDPIELESRWLDGKFLLPTTHLFATPPAVGSVDGYTGGYRKGNTPYVLIRAKFTPEANAFADDGDVATDGTFYVAGDGKFYTTTLAAKEAGNTTVAKYVEGKVLYYAWLNPDRNSEWYNSPVLRNNIYHIHITGFKTLGTNWNPLYPEDPDDPSYDPNDPNNPDPRPEPEDPDVEEPENPIDPEDPLTTDETYMSVDVTILPWLVHSYEVDLGI